MWLLDTTSLELELVHDYNVPYAILSHTWEHDEVTFQELKAGSGKEKQGYQKIVKTCEQARIDGYMYAWVDTCCINKESSAELSEAINSMWQWYCSAGVCYVYLSDVDGRCPELRDEEDEGCFDGLEDTGEDNCSEWHKAFRSSRWFTRGWTLQELLAPGRIAFYGHDWNFIGRKEHLISNISEITGIDLLALEMRSSLESFTIARKMSWAAGRKTSRVEDRAYSLLGILEINMPLLYGEGEKAFIRLQEQLMQISDDDSVLAWQRHKEGLTEDRLFAKSPDDFTIGKRIIRWYRGAAESYYRLTNQGIECRSSLFVESKLGSFTVLNCRLEDDLRGPLALRLQNVPDEGEWINRNQFWVGFDEPEYGDETDGDESSVAPSEHRHDVLVQSRRLIVYGGFEKGTQHVRTITMLRYDTPWGRLLYLEAPRHPKIWVRNSSYSSEDIEIVGGNPGKAWNLATAVMCLPTTSRKFRKHVVGSVTLRFRQSRTLISIAFKAPSIPVVFEDLAKLGFLITMCRSPDQAQARYRLNGNVPSVRAEVTDEVGNLYSAFVEASWVMGETVYVIEVSKESTSRSRSNEAQQPGTAKRRRLH